MTLVTALWCAGHINAAIFFWNLRHPGQPMPMPKCPVSARQFGP